MSESATPTLRRVLDVLTAADITHVVGLPDNTSAPVFHALQGSAAIRLVTVTREGEAFALASGLWLGGASPLVLIQNTGFLESGDALRGTALRMGVPLPCVITGRGYAKNAAAGVPEGAPLTRDLLVRPDVDSTALFTEPTLRAWGVPYATCPPGADPASAIRDTVQRARAEARPAALVLTAPLA